MSGSSGAGGFELKPRSRRRPAATMWLVGAALSPALLLLSIRAPWPWLPALIGRAHPMILHFPIALLLLVAAMEAIEVLSRGRTRFAPGLALFAGSFGAVLAASCGFLLMRADAVEGARVERHLWGGVTVATLAVFALIVQRVSEHRRRSGLRAIYRGLLLGLGGALLITGHDGSALTHGENYLTEHLPWNAETRQLAAPKFPTDRPHAQWAAYEQVIAPILQTRCIACHNSTHFKGKLVLDRWGGLMRGGKTGPLWAEGDPDESLLLERMLLPLNDEKHMPPKKKLQPSAGEIALVRLWIKAGSPSQGIPQSLATDQAWVGAVKKLPAVLTAAYQQQQATPAEEIHQFDPAKVARARVAVERVVAPLRARFPGVINYVSRESSDIRVNASLLGSSFGDAELAACAPLGEWMVDLDLSETGITDASAAVLAKMIRLQALRLNGTAISDRTVSGLEPLTQLESLGLFRTDVTDAVRPTLVKLPKLRRIYAAETKISAATLASFSPAGAEPPKATVAD